MLKAIYAELGAYKGLNGKTATIGGCLEYTGAPFYAAVSSLRAVCTRQGGDLAHVFCTQAAGVPIKSYSPEIIVHPVLKAANENPELSDPRTWAPHLAASETKVTQWFPAIHSLVVGPGLGRDPFLADQLVAVLIRKAVEASNPHIDKLMVIDADGLNVICKQLTCIRGYSQVILTPNVVEFGRLWKAAVGDEELRLTDWSGEAVSVTSLDSGNLSGIAVSRLARELGGCTVFLKVTLTQGPVDVISNGVRTVAVGTPGSRKRCGGIGDILSGTLSTLLHLATVNRVPDPVIEAGIAGSLIVRKAGLMAFEQQEWSLTAPDVLQCLPAALRHLRIEANTPSSL